MIAKPPCDVKASGSSQLTLLAPVWPVLPIHEQKVLFSSFCCIHFYSHWSYTGFSPHTLFLPPHPSPPHPGIEGMSGEGGNRSRVKIPIFSLYGYTGIMTTCKLGQPLTWLTVHKCWVIHMLHVEEIHSNFFNKLSNNIPDMHKK